VSRRLHRGALAAAFAVVLGVGISGCGAGFEAQSYAVDPDNAEASVGGVLVRNLVMVKAEEAPVAGIAGTFVNNAGTTDVLETVQIEGSEGSSSGLSGALSVTASLELPARSAVTVGAGDAPALVVPDAEQFKVGTFVTMTLTFREAGAVELKVPLEDASSYYASVPPTPTPTVTDLGTPTGEPAPGETTPLEPPATGTASPAAS